MLEKGFVTRAEWKAHIQTHPFVAHDIWPRIRVYVPGHAYSKAEIDAFFEPTVEGKKQILYTNVISLPAGAVPYGTGATGLAGATANLFYDAANNLFGVREATPTARVHVNSVGGSVPALNLESGAEGELVTPTGQQLRIGHWDAGGPTFTERLRIDDAGKFYVSYLTTGSVLFAGANGEVMQDNNDFFWSAGLHRLGLNLAGGVPQEALDMNGKLRLRGTSYSLLANYVSAGREILTIRGKSNAVDGAGINLYGDADATFPGQIKFFTNNVTAMTIDAAQLTTVVDLDVSAPVNIYNLSHDAFADWVAAKHYDWTNETHDFLTTGTLGCGAITAIGNIEITRVAANADAYIKINSASDKEAGILLYENDDVDWRIFNDGDDGDTLKFSTALVGEIKMSLTELGVLNVGTLALTSASITDSDGAIDFGNENLSTSGTVAMQNAAVNTIADFVGVTMDYRKTAGVTDVDDHFYAFSVLAELNQSGGVLGNMYGGLLTARIRDGQLGDASNAKAISGMVSLAELDGGKIYGVARGFSTFCTQDATNEITSHIQGIYIYVDADGTVGGNVYMLYLDEKSNVDYGIYQNGIAPNILGGNLGIGQSAFGANMTKGIAQATGVAPTTSPADAFQMYCADIGGAAGKAGVHFRGEDNNIVSIGTGGVLMAGTARVWNDLFVGPNSIKAPGTKPAVWLEHGISGVWQFADGDDRTVVITYRVPHRMDRTVAPHFHVKWSAAGESPGNCEWQLEYLWRSSDEDTTAIAQDTENITVAASVTANGLVVSDTLGLDLPSATDNILMVRVKRLAAGGNDTIADTVELHGINLHFTSNKMGLAM